MDSDGKTAAKDTFNYMKELADSDSDSDLITFYESYYLTYVPLIVSNLETDLISYIEDFQTYLSKLYDQQTIQKATTDELLETYSSDLKSYDSSSYYAAVSLNAQIGDYLEKEEAY